VNFVRQPEQLGLGHAGLCAGRVVGSDLIPVLLADDFLTYDDRGVTAHFLNAFEVAGKTQLSVMEVDGLDISKYDVVIPGGEQGSVSGLVEKPDSNKATSNLESIVRYVLTTDIFNILRNQPMGTGGEIQLADAIIIQAENDAVKLLGLMGVALIVVAWKAI
jgi:UTP--glucose-1-phosphate uridylyltransferase